MNIELPITTGEASLGLNCTIPTVHLWMGHFETCLYPGAHHHTKIYASSIITLLEEADICQAAREECIDALEPEYVEMPDDLFELPIIGTKSISEITGADRRTVIRWMNQGYLKAHRSICYRSKKRVNTEDYLRFADTYGFKIEE